MRTILLGLLICLITFAFIAIIQYETNIYTSTSRRINIEGIPCIVYETDNSVAISCDWKKNVY